MEFGKYNYIKKNIKSNYIYVYMRLCVGMSKGNEAANLCAGLLMHSPLGSFPLGRGNRSHTPTDGQVSDPPAVTIKKGKGVSF